MRDLWGYNARRDDFQRGIENVVHRTVFHTSRALVCPLNSIFFYRHYPLMSLERHQLGLRELHEIELCAGSGLDPRPEAKHRTSDSPIQVSCMGIGQTNLFACRRLLCSASRTSRDTPQSSIVWTLHTSLFIFRGLKFSNLGWLRFQSHGSSWLTGGTNNRKKALHSLEPAAIMRVATRFSGCKLYKLER